MKAKKDLSNKVGILISLVLSGAIGFFAARLGLNAASQIPAPVVLSLVILFVPAFFLVIAFHEGGHALAGVLVKFDFRMYVVGPFLWDKEQTGWKFKWNKNVNTSGGLVICLPTGTDNLSKRFSWYAAGGPLASLVLTALAYGVYQFLLLFQSTIVIQIIVYFLLMVSFLSLVIFIATVAPLHMGGFSSDGARVLRLLRGGDTARFEVLIIKILANTTGGTRPRLLDRTELDEAQVLARKLNAPFSVYIHSFFYQAAFDNNEIDQAEKHLHEYINEAYHIPHGIRSAVWLEAAFFYAFAKKDSVKATYYWDQFKPSALIPKAQVFATEAAIVFLKDDKEVMQSKIEASLKELPNMIDKGLGIALKEKLESLRSL
jgi:hypothetical protein